MNDITVFEALGYSILGLSIVFSVLILLWIVIAIMAKVLGKSSVPKPAAAAVAAPVPVKEPNPAPGIAGEVKLFDVPDRDAALIMAIVADKMQKPLNELRFKSIKEVK
ncbi:MAG: OadG family protein [Oscillospiraceae bacterium]